MKWYIDEDGDLHVWDAESNLSALYITGIDVAGAYYWAYLSKNTEGEENNQLWQEGPLPKAGEAS